MHRVARLNSAAVAKAGVHGTAQRLRWEVGYRLTIRLSSYLLRG